MEQRSPRLRSQHLCRETGTGISFGNHVCVGAESREQWIIDLHRAIVAAANDLDLAVKQDAQVRTHTRNLQRAINCRECGTSRVKNLAG